MMRKKSVLPGWFFSLEKDEQRCLLSVMSNDYVRTMLLGDAAIVHDSSAKSLMLALEIVTNKHPNALIKEYATELSKILTKQAQEDEQKSKAMEKYLGHLNLEHPSIHGAKHIHPNDIKPMMSQWHMFKKIERENAADAIIRFMQKNDSGWQPFVEDDLLQFLVDCGEKTSVSLESLLEPGQICRNYYAICGAWDGFLVGTMTGVGYLIKCTKGRYYVTDAFIQKCYKATLKNTEPQTV